LKNDKWQNYTFFHHTRYAKGATHTPAWKFHENDPTRVKKLNTFLIKLLYFFKTINNFEIITQCTKIAMPNKFYKNIMAHRLIVFPDDVITKLIFV